MLKEKVTPKKVVIFLIIILFAFGIYYLLSHRENHISIGPVREVPGSPAYSSIYLSESNLILSNGRYILSYANNASQKLSKTTTLPPVKEIKSSPDGNFVLFRTEKEFLEKPTLFEELNKDTISTEDSSFWWVVDVKTTNVASFFSDNSYIVDWSGNENVLYPNDNALVSYNVKSKKYEHLKNFEDKIVNFKAYGDNILLLLANGKIVKFNISSQEESILRESVGPVVFGYKEGCFLTFEGPGTEGGEEHSKASLIGCGSGNFIEIEQEAVYTPNFTKDGNYFIFFDGETYRYINLANGEKGVLDSPSDLSELSILEAYSLQSITFAGESSFFMSNNTSNYRPIGINQSLSTNNSVIDFFKKDQTIVASKEGNYTDADKKSILKKISDEGYSPDLYTIVFKALEPEGYRW